MSLWGRCLPRLTSTRESKAGVLARDDPRGLSSAVAILFLRMVLACANDVFWRLAQHIRPVPMELAWRISGDDLACEVCEIVWIFGRTCVVRIDTEVFGGEAKGKGCRKFVEHLHLPIEPCGCIGTLPVGPSSVLCAGDAHRQLMTAIRGITRTHRSGPPPVIAIWRSRRTM